MYFKPPKSLNFRETFTTELLRVNHLIEEPRFSESSMKFDTLRESSITVETDAVEHLNITNNWTTEMQQSFPYQHKSLLEDASRDAIFKLTKEETKIGMSTSRSVWVTMLFLLVFAFVLILLSLSCFFFS